MFYISLFPIYQAKTDVFSQNLFDLEFLEGFLKYFPVVNPGSFQLCGKLHFLDRHIL